MTQFTGVKIFSGPEGYWEHLERQSGTPEQTEQTVRAILERVRTDGDAAVREYTERFDGVKLQDFRVPQTEIEQAVAYVDPAVKDVWIQAAENIERFHQRQKEDSQL